MIRLVIFDLSDVCFTAEEPPFLKHFAEKYGLQFREFNSFYQELLIKSETSIISGIEVWKQTLKKFKLSENPTKIIKDMIRLKRAHPNVLAIAKQLRKNVKTAYLTNYNEDYWNEILKRFDMKTYFDAGIVSYMIKARKPDKNGFLELMNKFGVKPNETIFIDDSEKNLASAAELAALLD
jgi:putative hydrolase of the HAD superfamily